MKKIIIYIVISSIFYSATAQTPVFINEVNYNATNTADRGVGIAGPAGTNLSNWEVAFYDQDGLVTATKTITSGTTIDNEGAGYGEIWLPMPNVPVEPDTISVALRDATPTVIQVLTFSSDGTSITPVDGFAQGVPSSAITLLQVGNNGMQLIGIGTTYEDFIVSGWINNVISSDGDINTLGGQVFSVLPVELINFEAIPLANEVKINWSTATEQNNDKFILERSRDGIYFETIKVIEGAGTTNDVQYYTSKDNTPFNGQIFYRLKQVDFNGDFTYTDVIMVEYFSENTRISVYPNPLYKGQSLQIKHSVVGESTIHIFNSNGQLLKTSILNNSHQSINIDELSAGVYFYQVQIGKQFLEINKLVVLD